MKRVLLLAVLLGCSAPPANPKPASEKVTVTRDLLHAFRDAVYARYELRLLAEPGYPFKGKSPDEEIDLAKKNEARARERLVVALHDAGSQESRKGDEKLSELIPTLRDALVKTGRYAFIVEPESDTVSFALVRLVQGPQERTITIFGERFTYQLFLHDETVIQDYPSYRASRFVPGSLVMRPALTLGTNVYFDLAAASRIGRELFFPRVDGLRELAARAEAGDEPFLAQASDLARLLAVTKDVLRWRSLEGFWATVKTQPPEEQARRFAEDYEAREEVRAACEAFEGEKTRLAGDPHPSGEKLIALQKRAYLAAIVHGEPLSQVANVVGLASDLAATHGRPMDPAREAGLKAAAGVTVALVRQLAGENKARPDTAAEDAKDLARLARASAEQIQRAARAVRDQLTARPPG